MELLLNLAWLFLALPAYYVWRGRRATPRCTSLQCLLALGCVLVILFPVISATDDMLVMRNEMEESPASKRSLRHASVEKASPANPNLHAPAAVSSLATSIVMDESPLPWAHRSLIVPVTPAVEMSGRAPPATLA